MRNLALPHSQGSRYPVFWSQPVYQSLSHDSVFNFPEEVPPNTNSLSVVTCSWPLTTLQKRLLVNAIQRKLPAPAGRLGCRSWTR